MYKVFEDCGGEPTFLYHGVGGSKSVPLDVWIDAEIKWAREGSNPHYWTAFHAYPSIETVILWRHRTRRQVGRVVVEIDTCDVTKKPTRGEAYLARRMRVTSAQWASRRPLESIDR